MAFDPVLGARFLFDEADLAANAEGRVSPEQERLFDATVQVSKRQDTRVRVSLTIIFTLVGVLVVVATATTPGGSLAGGLVAGVIVAWILAIIAFFRRRARRYTRAFEERRVLTSEGPLNIRTTATQTWYAHVGEARVGVDRYQAEVLEEDGVYRVHYLAAPDGDIPLSIERA